MEETILNLQLLRSIRTQPEWACVLNKLLVKTEFGNALPARSTRMQSNVMTASLIQTMKAIKFNTLALQAAAAIAGTSTTLVLRGLAVNTGALKHQETLC